MLGTVAAQVPEPARPSPTQVSFLQSLLVSLVARATVGPFTPSVSRCLWMDGDTAERKKPQQGAGHGPPASEKTRHLPRRAVVRQATTLTHSLTTHAYAYLPPIHHPSRPAHHVSHVSMAPLPPMSLTDYTPPPSPPGPASRAQGLGRPAEGCGGGDETRRRGLSDGSRPSTNT